MTATPDANRLRRSCRGGAVRVAAILGAIGCLISALPSRASDATPRSALRLRITRGPDTGKQLTIAADGRVYSIGRYENNDLVCTDPYVSRRHATVECRVSGCTITDVGTEGNGSTNGTFVSGKKLEANHPAPLLEAEVVRLGPNTEAVLERAR